jgi:hypothetical protein
VPVLPCAHDDRVRGNLSASQLNSCNTFSLPLHRYKPPSNSLILLSSIEFNPLSQHHQA